MMMMRKLKITLYSQTETVYISKVMDSERAEKTSRAMCNSLNVPIRLSSSFACLHRLILLCV